MTARRIVLSLSVFGFLLMGGWPASAWQADLARVDQVNDLAVDAAGDVVAAVRTATGGSSLRALQVVKLRGADGRRVWAATQDGPDNDEAVSVAVDAAGDVVVAGSAGTALAVVKLDGATGVVLWQHSGGAGAPIGPDSVALDAAGDVLVLGGDFTVVKLRGGDGDVVWSRQPAGGPSAIGSALAVDAAGDPVAVGYGGGDWIVTKMSGTDGSDAWLPVSVAGTAGALDFVNAVAIDGSGDIVAAGELRNAGRNDRFALVKLAGTTGAELWRASMLNPDPDCPDATARAVTVDGAGDPVAVGFTCGPGSDWDLTVLKVAGTDGSERWHRRLAGTNARADWATGVVTNAAGDVFVGGDVDNRSDRCPSTTICGNADFTVLKLAGATGDELWRRSIDGKQSSDDRVRAVALDPSGNVIVGGQITHFVQNGLVAKFGEHVAGRLLRLRDRGTPGARTLVVRMTDPAISVPVPGTAGAPTVGGGTLSVANPTTGERSTVALPAANWAGLGRPPGARGYRYRDAGGGPCERALLRDGKITAICRRGGIGFTLDEPEQGHLAATLTTGAGDSHCAFFGGRIVADVPATEGSSGAFEAVQAPAVACPGP